MPDMSMPLPSVEPTIVLVDASPLIHLAMAGEMDVLLRFGIVVVPDAVEIEATFFPDKPYARDIAAWLDANSRREGANRWVERPATDIGELYRIAIETGRPRPRNAGEHAIVEWLSDHVASFGGPALVVYENGRVPNLLVREGLTEDVVVVTSRALLNLAERAGHLADADAVWRKIEGGAPQANPAVNYQIIKGMRP
jgi:hypothetical protein